MVNVLVHVSSPYDAREAWSHEFDGSSTIRSVKEVISREFQGSPPVDRQRLVCQGRLMRDDEPLDNVLVQLGVVSPIDAGSIIPLQFSLSVREEETQSSLFVSWNTSFNTQALNGQYVQLNSGLRNRFAASSTHIDASSPFVNSGPTHILPGQPPAQSLPEFQNFEQLQQLQHVHDGSQNVDNPVNQQPQQAQQEIPHPQVNPAPRRPVRANEEGGHLDFQLIAKLAFAVFLLGQDASRMRLAFLICAATALYMYIRFQAIQRAAPVQPPVQMAAPQGNEAINPSLNVSESSDNNGDDDQVNDAPEEPHGIHAIISAFEKFFIGLICSLHPGWRAAPNLNDER